MPEHSSSAIYRTLAALLLKYPRAFFKSINVDNLISLRNAIRHENPAQIIKNLQAYYKDISAKAKDRQQIINGKFLPRLQKISKKREVILLVSHEATRTGAPKLILKIAEHLMKKHQIQPVFILCRGGAMQREFAEAYPTYILEGMSPSARDAAKASRIIKRICQTVRIKKTIVNSAESRHILPFLRPNGIEEIVTLVHELASLSQPLAWNVIGELSDVVVFPVETVKREALKHNSIDERKVQVLAQGLLDKSMYAYTPDTSRGYIRKELGLSEDSRIVLGCGQAIRRKGPDLFTLTALSVLNRYSGSSPIYFIWLGAEPKGGLSTWMKIDLKRGEQSEKIKFIGAREHVNHYFAGSDVFFLSSRGDPHPCVVHEATAAGLPVVAFENSGGVPEMVFDRYSRIVPYADIALAAEAILHFLFLEDKVKFREKAIDHVRSHYDFDSYAEKVYQMMSNQSSDSSTSAESTPVILTT
jgi:glycosyltransferase involved in cell wall biosynthesis